MSWEQIEIGKISKQVKTGKTPPTKETKYFNGDIKWFTPSDLFGQKYLLEAKSTITQLAFDDNKAVKFQPNTLLINCIGDIGRVGIVKELCSSNQQLTGLVPKDDVSVNFLYYWFIGNKKILEHYSNSAVVPILNNRSLNSIKIPLPPLPVQERIAAILDAADALRQKDQALLKKYDNLTQSLFLDMFGDPVTNPKGWEKNKIGSFEKDDVILDIQDGNHGEIHPKSEDFKKEGIPMIFANSLTNNILDYSEGHHLSEKVVNGLRIGFSKGGDVLLTHKGSIGLSAVVPDNVELLILSPQVTYYRFNEKKVNNIYASLYFRSNFFFKNLEQLGKQSTRAYVGITKQRLLPFVLPPIELQNKYADRVKVIEKQKEQVQSNIKKSEDLFQSLFQKAFKGEWVNEETIVS